MTLALAIRARGDLKKLIAGLDKPEEIVRYADSSARTLREDLKVLNEEIARQQMLGQSSRGSLAYRNAIESHLALLGEILADPENFDFAAHLVKADDKANALFAQVVGKPATLVAKAMSDRWTTELTERARYESFQRESIAYEACPQVYLVDRWLDVWEQALPDIMKYVVAIDRDNVDLWMNWERDASTLGGVYQNPEALGK